MRVGCPSSMTLLVTAIDVKVLGTRMSQLLRLEVPEAISKLEVVNANMLI